MEKKSNAHVKPTAFILDVDGVMTTGQFLYSDSGKVFKVFGPDDHDGLSLLNPYINILFVTGDRKGFQITKKRIVEDMGFSLDLVSTVTRIDWIKERFDPQEVIYMGDGIFDHYVMQSVGYSIAPANAHIHAKKCAHFVTQQSGGDRAVAEACLHVLEKFFTSYNADAPPNQNIKFSREWPV